MHKQKHTEQAKQKISENLKLAWQKFDWIERNKKVSQSLIGNKRRLGKIPWNKGKKGLQKHSEEWKKGLSDKMKGNKFAFGKTHIMSEAQREKISKANKGRKRSEEQKKRLSEVLKGRPAWNKGIKFLEISGENHHNWKGGITPYRIAFWQSPEYKEWRRKVFERDSYTCKFCGISSKSARKRVCLEAHHIKKFSSYPELRLVVENGITLCKPCHKITKGKEEQYDIQCYKLISCKNSE